MVHDKRLAFITYVQRSRYFRHQWLLYGVLPNRVSRLMAYSPPFGCAKCDILQLGSLMSARQPGLHARVYHLCLLACYTNSCPS